MTATFLTIRDHTILATPLGPASNIIDAGSNRGRFAHAMVERFGCRVLAVEPTPALVAAYPVHEQITLVAAALAPRDGTVTFHLGVNSEASSVQGRPDLHPGAPIEVSCIRLEALLDRLPDGYADLVKMDVEGAEIEVLQQATPALLARIGQLTVEFHDFMGHNSRAVTDACIEHVRRAGFIVHQYRGGTDDVLMINRRVLSRPRYQAARLLHSLRTRLGGLPRTAD